jgi:antitoxin VapB
MKTAKLFRNRRSQAVRLPREFRFEGDEVLIKRVGDAVVLLPKSGGWESLVASLKQFSPDFMPAREQPGEITRLRAIKALGDGNGQPVGRRHNEFLYARKLARPKR